MKDEFKSIKTYKNKDEFDAAIARLAKNSDFYAALFKLSFPKIKSKFLEKTLRFFYDFYTKKRLKKITSVDEMQKNVKNYLNILIKKTTSEINISGTENLQNLAENPAIFISNHRDIVFDPAILNYALSQLGFETTKIAIGDNLVKNQMIEDLMRLNKSFLVQRNIKGIKENLRAMQILSEYINFSLQVEKSSIWLAQRQGRAKEGIDKTDKGVLKMLCLANKKTMNLKNIIENLNIIPVAISYEYDPCDFLKAKELQTIKATGAYEKSDDEDIKSMKIGLMGFKGKVSVNFCKPLNLDETAKATGAYEDINKLASFLDATIGLNYKLNSTNIFAFTKLEKTYADFNSTNIKLNEKLKKNLDDENLKKFEQRLSTYDEKIRQTILEIYANPVKNQQEAKNFFTQIAQNQ